MKFPANVNKFARACKRWANINSFRPEGTRIFPVGDGGYLVRVPMNSDWSRGFFFNGGDRVTVFNRCPNPLKWDRKFSGRVMAMDEFMVEYGGGVAHA